MNPKGGFTAIIAAGVVALLAVSMGPGLMERWSGPAPLPALPPAETQAATHLPFGPVRPARALPGIYITLSDGTKQRLDNLLAGHWTVVQLIFTGCSTTCPVQGAIFQETQKRLDAIDGDVRLLSISIDPLGDTPELLEKWRRQFEAGNRWQAAVPQIDDLGALLDVLGGRGEGVDIHNARAYFINPRGELQYITEEMPSPKFLTNLARDALKSSAGN
jgi:protein SCO1/2